MVWFFVGFSAFMDFVGYQVSFGAEHAESVGVVNDVYDSDFAFVFGQPFFVGFEAGEIFCFAYYFHDWFLLGVGRSLPVREKARRWTPGFFASL